MVLNIFPRKKEVAPKAATEPEVRLPEPSPEAMADIGPQDQHDLDSDGKRRTRRGTRGGRGRHRANGELIAEGAEELEPVIETAPEPVAAEKPKAPRRTRAKKADVTAEAGETEAAAVLAVLDAADAPARPVRRTRAAKPAPVVEVAPSEPESLPEPVVEAPVAEALVANGHAPRQHGEPRERQPREPRAPREPRQAAGDGNGNGNVQLSTILRAVEQQQRQIDQLVHLHEDLARRVGSGGGGTAMAPPARVGVFVDAANIELASDRLRARFDWKKILDMVTKDRLLVRAIAYSPVHDDPGVSIETQRFVEPFLDKGFKVVTKPLKRFADGTIKANVDIELALDVIEMLDRLDVVVLASGDGDFQRLVEVIQAKGIRVEVVSVGASTASNLRHAADKFIDIQARLRDVRVG